MSVGPARGDYMLLAEVGLALPHHRGRSSACIGCSTTARSRGRGLAGRRGSHARRLLRRAGSAGSGCSRRVGFRRWLFVSWARFPETTSLAPADRQTRTQAVDDLRAAGTSSATSSAPASARELVPRSHVGAWLIAVRRRLGGLPVWATLEALLGDDPVRLRAAPAGRAARWRAPARSSPGRRPAVRRCTDSQPGADVPVGRRPPPQPRALAADRHGAAMIGHGGRRGTAGPRCPGRRRRGAGSGGATWTKDDRPARSSARWWTSASAGRAVGGPALHRGEREASYWRLTSLDEFDGRWWRLVHTDRGRRRPRPGHPRSEAETRAVTQELQDQALSVGVAARGLRPGRGPSAPGRGAEDRLDKESEHADGRPRREDVQQLHVRGDLGAAGAWTGRSCGRRPLQLPDEIREEPGPARQLPRRAGDGRTRPPRGRHALRQGAGPAERNCARPGPTTRTSRPGTATTPC